MQNQNERLISLDISRALAISLVILTHATEQIFINYLHGDATTTLFTSIVMYTFFTLGRLGVPIFLFITGALLLKRNYLEKDSSLTFYKNNLLPLFLSTIFWIATYNLIDTYIFKTPFSVGNLIYELLFLKSNNAPHIWYMYMIIGLYFAIPFVATIVNKFPKKIVFLAGMVTIFQSMILPSFLQIRYILGINLDMFFLLDLSFLGGCYGVYCITGYYIANCDKNKFKVVPITLAGCTLGLATILIQAFALQYGHKFNVWYNFVLLYGCAICLMILISKITLKKKNIISLATYISRRSLALYFVHMPIRFILIKCTFFSRLNENIATLLFFVSIYCVSLLFIFIFERIAFIRKWIFLIK